MKLATLLHEAETASVAVRIDFRDGLAAFGAGAIDAVRPWLANPAMAAFAIRVIERVGINGEPALASKVLRSARSTAPAAVSGDFDWALKQIKAQGPGAPERSSPARHGPLTSSFRPSSRLTTAPRGRAR